jgi:hypothetical protein
VRRGALALAGFIALAGCGGADPTEPAAEPTKAGVEAALLARLEAKDLSVEWVVCVDEGAEWDGAPVYRCNVNFGDPHIEGYCALVEEGRLVTHVERPELRCARERTGEGEPVG